MTAKDVIVAIHGGMEATNMQKVVFLILLLVSIAITALGQETPLQVRYISSELVYLNGGRDHGLQAGDSVRVVRDSQAIATLSIVAIADRSASCRILAKKEEIKIGDQIFWARKVKTGARIDSTVARVKAIEPTKPRPPGRRIKKITGSLAGQYYQWNDLSEGNYDFNQPTARVNLQVKDLGVPFLELQVRTRMRYDKRQRAYTNGVPQKEWRNRLYQCYITYANPSAPINIKLGRIIDNPLSGIGYIDGLMGHLNLSDKFRFGVLAGTQPEWQYADFQLGVQKYGSFLSYRSGEENRGVWESSLAVAGEYHKSTVSREFVYLQNQYHGHQRLWLYQSAEIDINRGWRKEKSNQALGLSNFYFNANYDLWNWLALGLGLDSRQNFWTYEYRTMADSLFDDLVRRGARTQFTLRLPHHQTINLSLGMNKRDSDSHATFSYTASYMNNNVLSSHLLLQLYAAGFSSPLYNGATTNVGLGKSLTQAIYLNLRYGNSIYQIAQGQRRVNHQLSAMSNINIGRHLFLNLMYEYDQGDDEKGHRSWIELGYRF
jgi:hypothetical protein